MLPTKASARKYPVYSLYDTLNKKIPKRGLKTKELNRFTDETKITDNAKAEALFLLVIESAVRYDGFEPQLAAEGSPVDLPYGIVYSPKRKRVKITIETLPHELQWVLYKFLDVGIDQV